MLTKVSLLLLASLNAISIQGSSLDDAKVCLSTTKDLTINNEECNLTFKDLKFAKRDASKPFAVLAGINKTTLEEDSVTDLRNIKELFLVNLNIADIAPGAFKRLNNIAIHLSENKLQNIANGVFSGVGITRLYLDANQISTIAPEAFNDMPELTLLDISGNHLHEWNGNVLLGSPQVNELILSHNEISKLPANSFIFKTSGDIEKIDFSYNKITTVEKSAFSDKLNIRKLILEHNSISKLEDFTDAGITYLDLSGNGIKCSRDEKSLYETAFDGKCYSIGETFFDCDCFSIYKAIWQFIEKKCYIPSSKQMCKEFL